jgi:hypothetical protein
LGRVYFGSHKEGRDAPLFVQSVYGDGKPSAQLKSIAEEDLRRLIALLGRENCISPEYRPQQLIATVNALQPLG